MYKTILVPLDGTFLSERALPYAVRLARSWGAELVLYHWVPPLAIEQHPADERATATQVETLAAAVRDQGVAVDTILDHAAHEEVTAAILDSAAGRQVDFITLASHGRTGLEDQFLGSAAERVIRAADLPILVIPAEHNQPWTHESALRILVPLDGTSAAEAAIAPAEYLAHTVPGQIMLLQLLHPDTAATMTAAVADALAYVEPLRDRLRLAGCQAEARALIGDARAELEGAAERWAADLIVMATHSRRGLARLREGSVAAETVRRAKIPVLVVPLASASRYTGGPATRVVGKHAVESG